MECEAPLVKVLKGALYGIFYSEDSATPIRNSSSTGRAAWAWKVSAWLAVFVRALTTLGQSKNPASPAVKREAEEDWGR